jgi:hypothetical protein
MRVLVDHFAAAVERAVPIQKAVPAGAASNAVKPARRKGAA